MSNNYSVTIGAQRFMLWYSLIGSIIFFFCWGWMMGFFPPPSPSLPADQVVALYTTHHLRFMLGVAFAIISGGFMMPFSLVLSIQMARLEKGVPIWAILQLILSIIEVMYIWGPILIWGVAAFSASRDPALTVLLHELGWLSFITPLTVFPLQLIAVIAVCFGKDEDDRYSALPRWVGYLSGWQLIQSFGGPAALFFKSGIFAWNGLFPFWLPLSLFGAWFIALLITMFRALKHQERTALERA